MTSARRPRTDVTVRIDRAHGERFEQIVQALRKQGLGDVVVHATFLMVNGSAADADLEDLRRIEGVASVRPDTTYGTKD